MYKTPEVYSIPFIIEEKNPITKENRNIFP